MSRIDEFIDAAQTLFGLNSKTGRGRKNACYMEVAANASERRLGLVGDDHLNTPPAIVNPLSFLDGSFRSRELANVAPCVTFVVGQYGLGKTELAFQLCHRLLDDGKRTKPLPVNMSLCRSELALLDSSKALDQATLFKLLFSRVSTDLSIVEGVWQRVRSGEVILILDGIDELLTQWAQLRMLVSSMVRLLGARAKPKDIRFRVIMTVRLELLTSIALEDGSGLASAIETALNADDQTGLPIHTYFVQLGFLLDSHIEAYLRRTLPKEEDVFLEVRAHRALMDMLRRPLLLRIFSEVRAMVKHVPALETPARLVQMFVDSATSDQTLVMDQREIARETWDTRQLARASLALYARGQSELEMSDVTAIFQPREATAKGDIASQALLSIHKMPFLQVSSDHAKSGRIEFSHRIFFEYFVALGMHLKHDEEEFTEFDRLVLNVDMRRFLHDLMGEKRWFERTRRSYGLEAWQHKEWSHVGDRTDFGELDDYRQLLLRSMTKPEELAKNVKLRDEVEAAVHWFLGQSGLHPRYLVYNYEAVAIYVTQQRWSSTARWARERLEAVLPEVFLRATRNVVSDPTELREGWELLIERSLSVAQRLRSRWAKDLIRRDWSKLIQNPSTAKRIASICADIEDCIL